jgi:uncharacterized membrane protein (DUF106 family)
MDNHLKEILIIMGVLLGLLISYLTGYNEGYKSMKLKVKSELSNFNERLEQVDQNLNQLSRRLEFDSNFAG